MDIIPSLYHKGTTIIITPAEPKHDYPWVNLYISLDYSTPSLGINYPTKEDALRSHRDFDPAEQYVDTIQFKPKRKRI